MKASLWFPFKPTPRLLVSLKSLSNKATNRASSKNSQTLLSPIVSFFPAPLSRSRPRRSLRCFLLPHISWQKGKVITSLGKMHQSSVRFFRPVDSAQLHRSLGRIRRDRRALLLLGHGGGQGLRLLRQGLALGLRGTEPRTLGSFRVGCLLPSLGVGGWKDGAEKNHAHFFSGGGGDG